MKKNYCGYTAIYVHLAMSTLFSAIGIYQDTSVREAMGNDVLSDPQLLSHDAAASFNPEYPTWLSFLAWNGQKDPTQGSLAFGYDAHDMDSVSSMDSEDTGALVSALENPRPVLVAMLRLAVSIWPEIG